MAKPVTGKTEAAPAPQTLADRIGRCPTAAEVRAEHSLTPAEKPSAPMGGVSATEPDAAPATNQQDPDEEAKESEA